jgi:HEAT repeat protein
VVAHRPESNRPPSPPREPAPALPEDEPPPKATPPETGPDREDATDSSLAPLVKSLQSRKTAERLKACEELGRLGSKAKAASRALCEALLDANPQVRLGAAAALETVNPAIHRLVVTVLVDENLFNRAEAVRKIGKLGPEGKPAVPVLVYFKTQVQDATVVVEALAAIATSEKPVTLQFALWLATDREPSVRIAIARALPRMEGRKEKVAALGLALQGDRHIPVRVAAANALGELGSEAQEAVKVLSAAKTDPSAQVREAAANALEKIQAK